MGTYDGEKKKTVVQLANEVTIAHEAFVKARAEEQAAVQSKSCAANARAEAEIPLGTGLTTVTALHVKDGGQ